MKTSLTPGIYKIECKTFYINQTEMLVSDSIYVNMKTSPLQSRIMGGTVRTFQKGTVVKMDSVTKSYDPDLATKKSKRGMAFRWLCEQLNANGDVTGSKRPIRCPDVMTLESVPAEGVVYIDTRVTGKGYFLFNVTLTKDTRTAHAWQMLKVVDGFVPNVTVR